MAHTTTVPLKGDLAPGELCEQVYFGKLARQAELYDAILKYMEELGDDCDELSVVEHNLFSVAYKNAVGNRLTLRRVIADNDNVAWTREYCTKVGGGGGGAAEDLQCDVGALGPELDPHGSQRQAPGVLHEDEGRFLPLHGRSGSRCQEAARHEGRVRAEEQRFSTTDHGTV